MLSRADLLFRPPNKKAIGRLYTKPRFGLLLAFFLLLDVGCHRLQTPQVVCEAFLSAVREGDAAGVFDSLLENTQWAVYTVQKNHRKMRDLVEKNYPQGERAAAVARLYGAEADNGRELWTSLYPERYAASFTSRLGAGPAEGTSRRARVVPSTEHPGEYSCQSEGGQPFRLARSASGRLGIADLAAEWEQAELRAVHDLETVQKNADLYLRTGAAAASTR